MNRCKKLLEEIEPLSSVEIKVNLNNRLTELGFEDIIVSDAVVDLDGQTHILFSDKESEDDLYVIFGLGYEGPEAIIGEFDIEDEDDEYTVVDLSSLNYDTVETAYGTYLNLVDPQWITKAAFDAIFSGSELFEANAVRSGKAIKTPCARKQKRENFLPQQQRAIGVCKINRSQMTERKLCNSLRRKS